MAKDPEKACSAVESHLGYVKEMSEKEPQEDTTGAYPLDPKPVGLFKPTFKDNDNSKDGEAR